MKNIEKFLDSPTNRTGISIWLGTFITMMVQYFVLHLLPPSADLLGLVLGLVKIIQPENTVTVAQLQRAVADVRAALTGKNPEAISAVVSDAEGIASAVVTKSNSV
jgi:hypothetical protein